MKSLEGSTLPQPETNLERFQRIQREQTEARKSARDFIREAKIDDDDDDDAADGDSDVEIVDDGGGNPQYCFNAKDPVTLERLDPLRQDVVTLLLPTHASSRQLKGSCYLRSSIAGLQSVNVNEDMGVRSDIQHYRLPREGLMIDDKAKSYIVENTGNNRYYELRQVTRRKIGTHDRREDVYHAFAVDKHMVEGDSTRKCEELLRAMAVLRDNETVILERKQVDGSTPLTISASSVSLPISIKTWNSRVSSTTKPFVLMNREDRNSVARLCDCDAGDFEFQFKPTVAVTERKDMNTIAEWIREFNQGRISIAAPEILQDIEISQIQFNLIGAQPSVTVEWNDRQDRYGNSSKLTELVIKSLDSIYLKLEFQAKDMVKLTYRCKRTEQASPASLSAEFLRKIGCSPSSITRLSGRRVNSLTPSELRTLVHFGGDKNDGGACYLLANIYEYIGNNVNWPHNDTTISNSDRQRIVSMYQKEVKAQSDALTRKLTIVEKRPRSSAVVDDVDVDDDDTIFPDMKDKEIIEELERVDDDTIFPDMTDEEIIEALEYVDDDDDYSKLTSEQLSEKIRKLEAQMEQ